MVTAALPGESRPVPFALTGATRNTTLVPVGSPVMTCVVAVEAKVRAGYVHPLMIGVTAYPVVAGVPLAAPAVHETVACLVPATAVVPVGADGVPITTLIVWP